ncbi:MAG: enoyl-CoA hydratase/isomerase family protein [Bdellovibrionales bacterium]|nr:enoyl-CoA hydratase/isomerase family protein [Bdellovibrionales bacterium]
MSLVLYESVSKTVGKITFHDPDHLNAMGEDMADEFKKVIDGLKGNRNLRALILTGAGRAFSAGGHLNMLEDKTKLSGEENRIRMLEYYRSFLGMLDLSIPLVAAINGHAIGAGLCVACACDVRVCAQSAKLGFTFTRLGLHPGMGATYFLPRLIGISAASELMLTGRVIDAKRASEIGLVSEVVGDNLALTRALEIAEEISLCGPEANRQLLQTLRSGTGSLTQALEREASSQAINYASPEFKEGVRAAIEKRQASF